VHKLILSIKYQFYLFNLSFSDNYLIARRNTKVAEETSNLDTETEEIGHRPARKRRRAVIISDEEESPAKRSKHAAPPPFKKSLADKIKEKLSQKSAFGNTSKQTPSKEVPSKEDAPFQESLQKVSAKTSVGENIREKLSQKSVSENRSKKTSSKEVPPKEDAPLQESPQKIISKKSLGVKIQEKLSQKSVLGNTSKNTSLKEVSPVVDAPFQKSRKKIISRRSSPKNSPWKLSRGKSPLTLKTFGSRSPKPGSSKTLSFQSINISPETTQVVHNDLDSDEHYDFGSSAMDCCEVIQGNESAKRKLSFDFNDNILESVQKPKSPMKKSSVVKIGRTKVSTKPVSEGKFYILKFSLHVVSLYLSSLWFSYPAEQLSMITMQVEMKKRLDSIERLLASVLRAVRPSQKLVVPKDLPSLPLKSLSEFEYNEEYLKDKANKTDSVSSANVLPIV